MTLLLDTTVLVDALRRRNSTLIMLATATQAGHELSTSAVNVAEVYAGIRPAEDVTTQAFLAHLKTFPITESIAERGGRLVNTWARQGRTLGVVDMLIAATALEHGLSLITDNRKDFPMPEIAFYPLP